MKNKNTDNIFTAPLAASLVCALCADPENWTVAQKGQYPEWWHRQGNELKQCQAWAIHHWVEIQHRSLGGQPQPCADITVSFKMLDENIWSFDIAPLSEKNRGGFGTKPTLAEAADAAMRMLPRVFYAWFDGQKSPVDKPNAKALAERIARTVTEFLDSDSGEKSRWLEDIIEQELTRPLPPADAKEGK